MQAMSQNDAPMEQPTGAQASRKRVRCSVACTICRARKVRCNGGLPCARCARLDLACSYEDGESTRVEGSSERALPALMQAGHFSAPFIEPVFGPAEMPMIRAFFSYFHLTLPFTTVSTVHAGMNPLSLVSLGVPVEEKEQQRDLARKCIAWTVAAIGALVEAPSRVETYLEHAMSYLRQIIDSPTVESLSALIGVTECLILFNKLDLAVRYSRFTRVHFEEMKNSLPPYLGPSYAFLHCHLFALTNCRVVLDENWELPSDFSELSQSLRQPYMLGSMLLQLADFTRGINRNPVTLLDGLIPIREWMIRGGHISMSYFLSTFMIAYLKSRLGHTDDALQTIREAVDAAPAVIGMFNVPLLHIMGGRVMHLFSSINDQHYARQIQRFLTATQPPNTQLAPCVPAILFEQLLQTTLSVRRVLQAPAAEEIGETSNETNESSVERDSLHELLDSEFLAESDPFGGLEPSDLQYLRELF